MKLGWEKKNSVKSDNVIWLLFVLPFTVVLRCTGIVMQKKPGLFGRGIGPLYREGCKTLIN